MFPFVSGETLATGQGTDSEAPQGWVEAEKQETRLAGTEHSEGQDPGIPERCCSHCVPCTDSWLSPGFSLLTCKSNGHHTGSRTTVAPIHYAQDARVLVEHWKSRHSHNLTFYKDSGPVEVTWLFPPPPLEGAMSIRLGILFCPQTKVHHDPGPKPFGLHSGSPGSAILLCDFGQNLCLLWALILQHVHSGLERVKSV